MKLSKSQFLSLCGITHNTLNSWIEEEWLIPSGSSVELTFSEIDIARAQLIRDLKADFGVNDEGVGVILHLVDQLYGMRRTLIELHHAVRVTSEQGKT
jgi:chaperone modulatory protein CbpM